MAENDGQEKTEEPSQKRLDDARQEGQVPRSREFNGLIVMMVSSISLYMFGDEIGKSLMELMSAVFTFDKASTATLSTTFEHARKYSTDLFLLMLFIFTIFFVLVALLPNMIGGINFSTKALLPDLKRLDPIAGLKRIFSVQGLIELVKSLAKFVVIGTFGITVIYLYFNDYVNTIHIMGAHAILEAMDKISFAFIIICSSLILIALIDIPFQLWHHKHKLRMTKQELKDEHKQTDGNPELKGRIRQMQRQMSQARMMDELPKADVIITNPDHYAIAIQYDKKTMRAPVMIAKGVDLIAENIKAAAALHDLPIVSAPPLARALYYSAEIGDEVHPGLYVAVAKVLAFVFKLSRKSKFTRKHTSPYEMTELPIPDELKR